MSHRSRYGRFNDGYDDDDVVDYYDDESPPPPQRSRPSHSSHTRHPSGSSHTRGPSDSSCSGRPIHDDAEEEDLSRHMNRFNIDEPRHGEQTGSRFREPRDGDRGSSNGHRSRRSHGEYANDSHSPRGAEIRGEPQDPYHHGRGPRRATRRRALSPYYSSDDAPYTRSNRPDPYPSRSSYGTERRSLLEVLFRPGCPHAGCEMDAEQDGHGALYFLTQAQVRLAAECAEMCCGEPCELRRVQHGRRTGLWRISYN